MKNIALRQSGILTLVAVMSFLTLSAQDQPKAKSQTVVIKTTAECRDCKERIESKLNYTKGIIFAELDIPTKQLTVKFKTSKITLDEIKKIISEIGYDANDVKANAEKQKELPKCCQPGGMK
jgi:mercuric ion binding protein